MTRSADECSCGAGVLECDWPVRRGLPDHCGVPGCLSLHHHEARRGKGGEGRNFYSLSFVLLLLLLQWLCVSEAQDRPRFPAVRSAED